MTRDAAARNAAMLCTIQIEGELGAKPLLHLGDVLFGDLLLFGLLGLEGKSGSGEHFGKLYKEDQGAALAYLEQDLKVSKGSRVLQGQIIGKVEKSSLDESDTKENYLHFELRKGTKSLDPLPLFQ